MPSPRGQELPAPQAGSAAPEAAPDGAEEPLRIDAIVTDRQGRPVADLRPSDFTLFENGVRRPLTAADFRGPGVPGPRPPRVFAFLVDEFHVSPGAATDRVRDALARFIDEHLQPDNLALVTKPLDDPAARFSRDRAPLRAAIASFSGRQGDLTPRGDFEAQYIGRAPAAVAAGRAQIVAAALRSLTLRLGDLHADRPVLVIISDGLPPDAGPRGGRADLQGLVRAASQSHLAIYAFSPGGQPVAAADAGSPAAAGTLAWLAEQSGGRAFAGDDLSAGLDRLARDVDAYYAVTTAPPRADGRFHALELRTTRRNVEVHARPGYWAPFAAASRASISMMPPLGRPLHRSALVDTWVGLSPDAAGRMRMVVSWESRAGSRPQTAMALVRARGGPGADLFSGRIAAAGSTGASDADSARFAVPAGRVELDLDLLDAAGKVIDRDTRDIDVPNLPAAQGARVRIFPQLLRARTFRDFEAILGNLDAAPSAARAFQRGDRLLLRVPAFDPGGGAVEVSASVLNGRAQPMRDIEAVQPAGAGVAQFALPLSWLGPGQYLIQIVGRAADGATTERLAFSVSW